jgi:hypothetical protein
MTFSVGVVIISQVPLKNSINKMVDLGKSSVSLLTLMDIFSGPISITFPVRVVPSKKNSLSWHFNENDTSTKI